MKCRGGKVTNGTSGTPASTQASAPPRDNLRPVAEQAHAVAHSVEGGRVGVASFPLDGS